MYEWPTNLQASLYIALSGYLVSTGYSINDTTQNDNINLLIGFPDDLVYITDRTIAIDFQPTFNMIDSNELGKSFGEYKMRMNYIIFTKTDRDREVLWFELNKHFNEAPTYYNWSVAVTGGLVSGQTEYYILFNRPSFNKIRNVKYETNELLNHRGVARVETRLCSNDLL